MSARTTPRRRRVFGRDVGYAAFFYPPMFLILCLPLGLLPYLASLAVWLAATGLAYVRVVRAWLGERLDALPALAFPAVLVNAGHGQNGFLSAALFGAGALWLERRPILAGVCFGCLVYKPQLGLMIPLALLAAGRWKTLAGAAGAAVAFSALSLLHLRRRGLASLPGRLEPRAIVARAGAGRRRQDAERFRRRAAVGRRRGPRLWRPGRARGVRRRRSGLAPAPRVPRSGRGSGDGRRGPAGEPLPARLRPDPAGRSRWPGCSARARGRASCRWEKTTMLLAFVLPAISRTLATQAHIPLAPLGAWARSSC